MSAAFTALGKSSPVNSADEQSPPKIVRRRTPNSAPVISRSDLPERPSQQPSTVGLAPTTADLALSGDIYPTTVTRQVNRKPAYEGTPLTGPSDSFPGKRLFESPASTLEHTVPDLHPQEVRQPQISIRTTIPIGDIPSVAFPAKVAEMPLVGRGYGRGAAFSQFTKLKPGLAPSLPSPPTAVENTASTGFATPQLHHPPTIQRTATAELPKPVGLKDAPSPPRVITTGRGRLLQSGIIKPPMQPTGNQQASQMSPTMPFLQTSKNLSPASSPNNKTCSPPPPLSSGSCEESSPPKQRKSPTRDTDSDNIVSPLRPAPPDPGPKTQSVSPSLAKQGLQSLIKNPQFLEFLPKGLFENPSQKKMDAVLDLISAIAVLNSDDTSEQNQASQESGALQDAEKVNVISQGISEPARESSLGQNEPLTRDFSYPPRPSEATACPAAIPEQVDSDAPCASSEKTNLLDRYNRFLHEQVTASQTAVVTDSCGPQQGRAYQPCQRSPQRLDSTPHSDSCVPQQGPAYQPREGYPHHSNSTSHSDSKLVQSYQSADELAGRTELEGRQPVLTSPSMYSSTVVKTNQTDNVRAPEQPNTSAYRGYSDQLDPETNRPKIGRETMKTLQPSSNMIPLSHNVDSSVPFSNSFVSVAKEDERKSGSDSGSTSTGSKLLSRIPNIATSRPTIQMTPPATRAPTTSEMPVMIIDKPKPVKTPDPSPIPLRSILKKPSPPSVSCSDSDKEGVLQKKKVNLKLPTQKEAMEELDSESDSDSDDGHHGPTLSRDCHRGRRLLELLNPEVYERKYLKNMMAMTHADFETVLSNDSGVVIDGEGVPKNPSITVESSNLADYIKNRLSANQFPQPSMIQSWCWPVVMRGLNVIGIAPRRGKTLAYLGPLASLILQRDSYSDLPPGNGPIALILAASWRSAMGIFDHCRRLIGELQGASIKVIYGDGNEEHIIVEMINGCDILVATPHCLNRMLEGEYTNFERLCHLVIDDGDTLTEDFTDQIRIIMNAYNKVLEESPPRTTPCQMMVFSSQWTPGIQSFNNMCMHSPAIIITSSYEAAIYGGVKQIPIVCQADQRFQKLPGLLEELSPNHDKIIIFTNTPEEADDVHQLLQNYCINSLLYTHAMLTDEIEDIKRDWKQSHDVQSKPVLVMTDGGIPELHITDATCVIHYSMSETKTKFGNRLGCMEDYLKVISRETERELVSYMFIYQECARQAPTLLRLLKRIGVEPPKNLELLAAGVMEGREEGKQQPLCHYLKSYGRCRDVKKCPARHVVSAEIDQPNPQIPLPQNGEVKILITHVANASHYYARIQEHRQFSGPNGEVTKNTSFASAACMLNFEMLKYFQAEPRRVSYQLPRVDDLCAVDDKKGVFSRARVVQVPRKLSKDSEVEVFYVDEGKTESVKLANLYLLPEHLNLDHIPPTVVEIYICGVKPMDKDIEWTTKTSVWIYNLICRRELHGTIVLSLGNTLWLENLIELTYLTQLRETIHQYSVKKELLSNKLAVKNPEHLTELYKLCQGKVDIPLLTVPTVAKKGDAPKYMYTLGCINNELLPEADKYHEVCVSAVDSPDFFFVQKFSSQNDMEEMVDEINKDTESLEPVDPNMITSGMLCLAKFSETDTWYRAQFMSMKENTYKVFFVDYGDQESVPLDSLRALPEKYAQLPLQAIECSLVKISSIGNNWEEADIDAFWDMCLYENGNRKKLFAEVRSRSDARIAGKWRCHVELTDTTSGEDVLLSQELVSSSHALATPESIQELLPDVDLDLEHEAEEHEKIPFFCARMYLTKVASEAVHLAQACKDLVEKYYRKDILKTDAHIVMAKVVAFLPEQTCQYLLLQALSVLLEDDRAKEEARENGILQAFCRILGKESSTTLCHTEVVQMLSRFSFDHRYCYEIGYYGGIKHLCTLAGAMKQENICLKFLKCLSALCHGYEPNCELVKDCDGIRVLSRLLVNYDKKENMQCILGIFDLLVNNLESTDVMRKNGAIESLVRNLARTVHIDLIGDIATLLKTLSGHSSANKKAMREEEISDALEKHCRKNSRCSADVRSQCKDLYRMFNPAGYIDPDLRLQPTRPTKHVNGVQSIENTPIVQKDMVASIRVPAEVHWSQKQYSLLLTIKVPEVRRHFEDFKSDGFIFRATVRETEYFVNLDLFQNIVAEKCVVKVMPSCVQVGLVKAFKGRWPRLLKQRGKLSYIKTDMDRYINSSSESENEDPDESPFLYKRTKTFGEMVRESATPLPEHLRNPQPEPLYQDESSDSESYNSSDNYDETVMRWADKDPFDVFN